VIAAFQEVENAPGQPSRPSKQQNEELQKQVDQLTGGIGPDKGVRDRESRHNSTCSKTSVPLLTAQPRGYWAATSKCCPTRYALTTALGGGWARPPVEVVLDTADQVRLLGVKRMRKRVDARRPNRRRRFVSSTSS